MKNLFKLTTPQILDIEVELNSVSFIGIQVGGLFADVIFSSALFNEYTNSPQKTFINWLLSIKNRYAIGEKVAAAAIPPPSIKYIFYYSSNSSRFLDFYKPLLGYFNKDEVAFAGEPKHQYFDDYFYFTYRGLPPDWEKKWQTEFNIFKTHFFGVVKKLKKKYNFPTSFIRLLYLAAISQTKKLFYFYQCFKASSVKAFLADHDRNTTAAAISLAAKKAGIHTFTLIHGSTYPGDNFYPLLADHMFCWSYAQKQQMENFGIPSASLLVSGNQKLLKDFTIDKDAAKQKIKLPQDKKIVLVTTSPIKQEERVRFVQDLCSILDPAQFYILLRIHPIENKEDYKDLVTHGNICIVGSSDQTIEESFICSDLLITHKSKSVVIIDALVKKLPSIVYSPAYITSEWGVLETAIKEKAVLNADNTDDLLKMINSLEDASMLHELQKNIQEYTEVFCSFFGDDAAGKIVNYLKM